MFGNDLVFNNMLFDEDGGSGGSDAGDDTSNTDNAGQDKERNKPVSIPKYRFDQEIAKRKALEERLNKMENEQRAEAEKRLKEQNEWKQLYEQANAELEEAKTKVSDFDAMNSSIEEIYQNSIKDLSEEAVAMIPEQLTTQQKLQWVTAHKTKLQRKPMPNVSADGRSDNSGGGGDYGLTPDEIAAARRFGMSLKDYALSKDGKLDEIGKN